MRIKLITTFRVTAIGRGVEKLKKMSTRGTVFLPPLPTTLSTPYSTALKSTHQPRHLQINKHQHLRSQSFKLMTILCSLTRTTAISALSLLVLGEDLNHSANNSSSSRTRL